MKRPLSRRTFLATGAASASVFFVPRRSWASVRPAERFKVAVVGCGGRGWSLVQSGGHEDDIVALCDVDLKRAGGAWKAKPDAKKYRDYREMLATEKDLDAVMVGTPDHMHAPIAAAAIRRGLHVYVEKPLTWSIEEARLLTDLAKKHDVATQMGNQGSSHGGLRAGVERLRAGVLGEVREVHVWTNRPVWPQGFHMTLDAPVVPAHLDWDLWLGCAKQRPYHGSYLPFVWRGFHDFGTGALGDMACHTMNLVWRGLDLGVPVSARAETTDPFPVTYPKGAKVVLTFPARGDRPPVNLTWWEGSMKPPKDLLDKDLGKMGGSGTLVIGSKGKMFSGDDYQVRQRWLPKERGTIAVAETEPRAPRGPQWGHVKEWVDAAKAGKKSWTDFSVAGPFTEAVLIGDLAIRTAKPIDWNTADMDAKGLAAAKTLVRRDYRKGFGIK